MIVSTEDRAARSAILSRGGVCGAVPGDVLELVIAGYHTVPWNGPRGEEHDDRKGMRTMATLVVLHRVRDYRAWRQAYEEFEPVQKAGGVIAESVYQAKDDPNNVLVLHSFDTMAAAEAFVAKPELRDAMQKAGVEGEPRIEFFEEAK